MVHYATHSAPVEAPVVGSDGYRYWMAAIGDDQRVAVFRSRAGDGDAQAGGGGGGELVLDMGEEAGTGSSTPAVALGVFVPHASGWLAYTVDSSGGGERYGLRLRQVGGSDRHEAVEERIDDVGTVAWAPGWRSLSPPALYYTRVDVDSRRAASVWRHVVGTPPSMDVCLGRESDARLYVEVVASKDGALVTVTANSRDAGVVAILDYAPSPTVAATPVTAAAAAAWAAVPAAARRYLGGVVVPPPYEQAQLFVSHDAGRLVALTNATADHASRVLIADLADLFNVGTSSSAGTAWRELLPPDDADDAITDIDVFAGGVAVFGRRHGAPRLRWVTTDGSQRAATLRLPPDACDVAGGANAVPTGPLAYTVTSVTAPPRSYVFNPAAGTVSLTATTPVGATPGRPLYAAADYVSYVLHARSHDGVAVPVTIVHRADLGIDVAEVRDAAAAAAKTPTPHQLPEYDWRLESSGGSAAGSGAGRRLASRLAAIAGRVPAGTYRGAIADGGGPPPWEWRHTNPTQLHVYGAYGTVLSPEFTPHRLPLLNRGWVVAYAHTRGGGELGPAWYAAGRGVAGRRNVLADAAAAARLLVAARLTRASLLTTRGESAGGLVSAWLANTAPGAARAHILRMPFLNVLGDLASPHLPLSAAEAAEYGDPADPAVAAAIAGYDPMANLPRGPTPYPHIYATGAAHDYRVPPYHPLAFVAALRSRLQAGTNSSSSGNPLLLCRILQDGANHFGASTREGRAADRAAEVTFLHAALGLEREQLE